MQAALQRSPQRLGWTTVATALGIVIVAGASIAVATQCLRSNHNRSLRLREAKKRYRQLVSELSECKGILNFMDSETMPQAQRLADEAQDGDLARVGVIHRQLMLMGEQLLQLMERIDGVAPALVLDAAQVEPWAEHDEKLKAKYEKDGLGAVFELAGDLRAIRKGMSRKAERRAQAIDKLKSSVKQLLAEPSVESS
ncbi:hypothetical protein GGH94_006219 [Coemansia aciculifera]|uniref:Uncharacterized protein n=2 Tax=Coemansia TaxID=4863 RepID=A0A9W8M3J7_9FUNG|nr:hypothetical protein GGH94_006219 [Coemansia aciculifera]KAJ2869313.1 hypothetical protein GGH93_006195 [Coemansia aciculifera]KAJ2885049.1 hypothetical protein H4R27_001650 [Coemansia aciculifera]